jgi:hypothetical protein
MLFSTCAFRGNRRWERRSFSTDVNKIDACTVGNHLNVKNALVKSVYYIKKHNTGSC